MCLYLVLHNLVLSDITSRSCVLVNFLCLKKELDAAFSQLRFPVLADAALPPHNWEV